MHKNLKCSTQVLPRSPAHSYVARPRNAARAIFGQPAVFKCMGSADIMPIITSEFLERHSKAKRTNLFTSAARDADGNCATDVSSDGSNMYSINKRYIYIGKFVIY